MRNSTFMSRFQDWLSDWSEGKTRISLVLVLAVLMGLLLGMVGYTIIKQIFYGLDEKRTGNLGIDACMAIYFLCTYSKRICRSCNHPIAQGLAYTCFKCHADGVVPKFQVCLSCFSSGAYQHPHASSDMLHDYALFEQLLHHKSSRSLHPDDSPAPVRIMESQQVYYSLPMPLLLLGHDD